MKHTNQHKYYNDLVERFGNSRDVAGWGSQASQEARFKIFSEGLPFDGKSVIDVGCGRGDLLSYLKQKEMAPSRYIGIDIIPDILGYAMENHPEITTLQADLLSTNIDIPQSDVAVSSGVFNLRQPNHEIWIAEMLEKMFKASRIGTAINIMSTYAPEYKVGQYYAEPSIMLDMGFRLSPYVSLRHDYAKHDMTLFVYRMPNTT